MGSAKVDPTEPTDGDVTPPKAARHRILKARVESALSSCDWATLERLADTRNTSRAHAVGFRLARVLPAEEARLESWLDGPKAAAALFALAIHARRDHDGFFELMERMSSRQPAVVERAMRRQWTRHSVETLVRVTEIAARLSKTKPYPARAVTALVGGLDRVAHRDPMRSLDLLASLFPAPGTVRSMAADIIGRVLLARRTEETAAHLESWLDEPALARVTRDAFRDARRSLVDRPSRSVRLRLVQLRSHPRLGPLL